MGSHSVLAVLTRHFLRRFLENDLISPEADRSHLLAVIGAFLFSTTIFVTMMMSSFKYVVGYYTPGQAAVSSLDDKFFYISLSMVVVSLIAVAQWDALVVDARDAAILDPLPVRPLTIRRAKIAAVAIFACGAALVVNLAPTVIFPLLLLVKQRVGLGSALLLIATHALVMLAAAAFGFLSIVALRETLAVLLGPRWFRRVSPWAQGLLVVILGTALLLLPPLSTRVERDRLDRAAIAYAPPAWFLGAYEELAGWIVIDAPRYQLNRRLVRADVAPTAAYRRHRAQFGALALRSVEGLSLVTLLAAAAYLLNARRQPDGQRPAPRPARGRWLLIRGARLSLLRTSTARAGFFFTLAAVWRSNTHRLTLACAGAAGLAMSLVALSGIDMQDVSASGRAIPRLLIVQPFLMGALLVGFRHAIRVPAELRANWGFQLAWRGHELQFLAGARRAALLGVVLPALAAVFVLDILVLGWPASLAHGALGLAGAIVLLEALLVGYNKVPFTCSYVPSENMKALGPIYLLMFVVGALSFARMESAALNTGDWRGLVFTLLLVFVVLRAYARRRVPVVPVDFDEAPATTQQLGLHA